MSHITLGQAAQWCGGHVEEQYRDVEFFGACNDTRNIQPGQLFLALKGARDGHEFIPAAMEKGAAAVLCTHSVGDYPAIIVEDVRLALGQIAKEERQRLGCKVVAVTGSVGKSTTKEMIVSVLQTTYKVGKTPVNHNNDIGMPMAILALEAGTEVAVLEMGMNHFGEISYLTKIARPDVAVITNIGTMHIEHLGSRQGILRAKMEIVEGMSPGGILVVNGDDRLLAPTRIRGLVTYRFGYSNWNCDVKGSDIAYTPEGLYFKADCWSKEVPVTMKLEGEHFVSDALAAVAVGWQLHVTEENISMGLGQFQNMTGRQEIFEVDGYTIINDCYNAGPESMAAALTVLHNKPGRHVAVLGDMLELGICAQAEHYKLGRLVAEKADVVLAYGPNSIRVLNGAYTGGMSETKARAFTDQDRLTEVLKQLAKPGDVILFKGSRGMHLERILERFLQKEECLK